MIAVILSGGLGTRLHPLTLTTPKAMLPIAGKPHLEYQIELLRKHGFKDIIFSTGYLHEQIVQHFGVRGERANAIVRYKEDGPEPLGTAGALRNCLDLIDEHFVLVLNGDILTNIDLTAMKEEYFRSLNPIMMALTPVDEPAQYGVAKVNENNKVIRFEEKPTNNENGNLINAGIYMMTKDIIQYHIPEGFSMIENTVFPRFSDALMLGAYVDNYYWLDIGTHERYAQAQQDVKTFFVGH